MKNFHSAVLWVFLLALFANAQEEVPPPLLSDSVSLAAVKDSSLESFRDTVPRNVVPKDTIPKNSSLVVACPVVPLLAAKEQDYQNNLRVVAYLHPLQLFFGAANNMLMFSSTVEVPLSLSNSVIIQPVVWLGSSDGYIADVVEYEKLKRAGGGIGIRRYAYSKGQGFYLQMVASLYYISAESLSHKEDEWEDDYDYSPRITTWTKVKGMVGELMFYVGSVHKWQNVNLFYEGGLGFGYDGTDTFQMGYVNRLAANFNLGVGLPF